MRDEVFWAIRYTVLGVSLILALLAIMVILKFKLYERLLMVYICIAAGCEGLMALSALLFNESFIEYPSMDLNTKEPELALSQLQGFIFRASELTSFAVTTAMTMIIYCSVDNHIDDFNRKKNWVLGLSVTIPSAIALPMAFYKGNGPCCQGEICFNCACPNPKLPYWIYALNWMVPCVILTALTIWLIVLIERHRKTSALRDEQILALKAYYIPLLNFSFLILNLVLDSVGFLIGEDQPEVVLFMILNLFIFMMPVFNLGAIRKYYHELDDLYKSPPSLITSSSHKQMSGLNQTANSTNVDYTTPCTNSVGERLRDSFHIEG